jgi:hypothetical protein
LKEALSKIKYIFPAEKMQSNIAIFFSIFALFFAVGSSNVPCLNADTCSVGSDEVFSGTVTIQNNTNYGVKLTGNPTANRTITFPDADGTVKLAGATLTADKMLASDTNGEVAVTDKYPFTLGTAGQFLKVASTGLTMDFLTVGGLDSLTANAPYLSVNSSGAIDSSATLTASTPLKSNAQGQITASDLDPTTDIAVGSATAGQILQVGTSSALEWANPSGGGSVSLTAKGSITGGKVVASVVDGTALKVEPIVSFQSSVDTTDYSSTDTNGTEMRYNHYNAIADKYIQCYISLGYLKCRTGSFNTATNEITWDTAQNVSSYYNYISSINIPTACAYADDSSHNYYMCIISTSSYQEKYLHLVTFYINSTGQLTTADTGSRLCWGNSNYSYSSCGYAVPVWDMQTNTWVIVSSVNEASGGTNNLTSDYGLVISKNYVPSNSNTCNGANCGFDSNYDNALKVNGPYNNNTYFNSTYWQLALDQRNGGYKSIHAVALDNGNSNDYEYAVLGKADSSGSAGNMEDAGWSIVHLERTSIGGNYSTGTVIENFNDMSANTGTVNQFCGGNTNNNDSLHDNVYGQGTTDVGFYFIWTCTENTTYGGSGEYAFYGNFFSPNPATNTFDLANTEGISVSQPSDSVFGGGISGQSMYFTNFRTMFKDNTILFGGANYFAEPDGTYLGCNSTYYCSGTLTAEWNSNKTDFTPTSFKAYSINDYAYASPIHNTDENIFTYYFVGTNGNSIGYITPTIDKNRGSWIGFLNTSASDGDTVTVNIISGKATGLTGLTVGTSYYVGGDGSLVTSGDSTNKFCVAISQTECLILNSNF